MPRFWPKMSLFSRLSTRSRSALRLRVDNVDTLRQGDLRELWELRIEQLPLKPTVDPEEDFAKFSKIIANASEVNRVYFGDTLVGMFASWRRDGVVDGKRFRWIAFEYGATKPEWRGARALRLAYLRTVLVNLDLRPGTLHYVGGIGYPIGAMVVARFGEKTHYLGEEVPAEVARIFDIMLEELAPEGLDSERGGVIFPTVPRPLSEGWLQRRGEDPSYRRYIALNPNWQEGRGLPVLSKLGPGQTTRAFAKRLLPGKRTR